MKLEGMEKEPESIMDEVENVIVIEDYQQREKQREEMGSIMDEMEDTNDTQFMTGDNASETPGFESVGTATMTIEADGTVEVTGFEQED